MKITEDTVKKIASLSKIALSESQTGEFTGQLGRIINYMDMLDKLDTSGVEPTSQVVAAGNVLRKDEPSESLSPEKALENAPEKHKTFFKVPGIIDFYES